MARVANGENAVEIQCWFCSQSLWKAGLLRKKSHTGFALRSCMMTAFDGLNSLSKVSVFPEAAGRVGCIC